MHDSVQVSQKNKNNKNIFWDTKSGHLIKFKLSALSFNINTVTKLRNDIIIT